jgi:hypothetical protein
MSRAVWRKRRALVYSGCVKTQVLNLPRVCKEIVHRVNQNTLKLIGVAVANEGV